MPSRSKTKLSTSEIPTTFNFRRRDCMRNCCWVRICSSSMPPTVPIPQIKMFSTLYSERKKESCNTLSDLRRKRPSTTNEIFVSDAPWAQAITEIPERPSVPKSLPAIPGLCFMFSPTIAMVARPLSACMGNMAPVSISLANSLLSTSTAASASSSRTPILVEFSDDACDTMNTEIPLLARVVKIRRFTPITPTIDRPVTVIRVVPLIEEIPLMGFMSSSIFSLMRVPGCSGLNVFLTLMGIFLMQTG